MAIGSYTHQKLVSIIRQTHQRQPHSDTSDAGGSDTHLQYNNGGSLRGISTFTFDGTDMKVADDVKIKFGTNNDSHIEYDENGEDILVISGSSAGIKLRGTKVEIDGTLEGASPLKIGGAIQFVGAEGDQSAFNFGR